MLRRMYFTSDDDFRNTFINQSPYNELELKITKK